MDTPQIIAKRLDVDFRPDPSAQWHVTDFQVLDDTVTIWGENDDGDEIEFMLLVSNVQFMPGPPTREDFESDREEPGDGPVE
jgi:hypothetical protein